VAWIQHFKKKVENEIVEIRHLVNVESFAIELYAQLKICMGRVENKIIVQERWKEKKIIDPSYPLYDVRPR
jgi:hypothetical protein